MRDYKIMFFTDDDQDDLYLMKEVSDLLGHNAELFHDGDKMLLALQNGETKPDIIFLDINMPKINGFDVLGKLGSMQHDFKKIPVVIHSSHVNDLSVDKCFELGANYYITKANNFHHIKSAIEYVVKVDWTTYTTSRENFIHRHS